MAKNEKLAKLKAKKAAKATEKTQEVKVTKAAEEAAKIENLSVPKKEVSTKKIDKKQIETINKVVEVKTKREMKWKFPEGMEDTLERKKFRQKNRNKVRDLDRLLSKDPENEKLKAEVMAYRELVLIDPNDEV